MIISYEQEQNLCKALLKSKGMAEREADILAASIAHSDFTGIYSHGLSRFSNYLKRFDNGAMNAAAPLIITSDTGAAVCYDCSNGCGVVSLTLAYEQMSVRAKEHGIVIATGRHSSNIGCGSYYGEMAARDGLIGMFCCNTVKCVAPFGGADSLLGTNPIIVAIPAGEEKPMIMDISTSVTAMGKIQAAAREGKPIPDGWALDESGQATTDAAAAKTVLPIAGPKGYGLAVIVEAFSALLAQAAYGDGIGVPNRGEQENTGWSMILIDVEHFMPLAKFKSDTDSYIRSIKSSRKAPGVLELLMPGELEHKKLEQYLMNGYEVSDALANELLGYAVRCGLVSAESSFSQLLDVL